MDSASSISRSELIKFDKPSLGSCKEKGIKLSVTLHWNGRRAVGICHEQPSECKKQNKRKAEQNVESIHG